MAYRLHARIANVEYVDNNLELGKQYNIRWDDFKLTYFGRFGRYGRFNDEGMIAPDMLDEFLRDLKKINHEIIENKESYDLYNIHLLEKMFKFAKENNYYVSFEIC